MNNEGCVELRIGADLVACDAIEALLDDLGFERRGGGLRAFAHTDETSKGNVILCGARAVDGYELWFCVPRVTRPDVAIESMLAIAKLAANMTEAKLVDAQGSALDENALRARVQTLTALLARARVSPGFTGISLL